MSQTKLIMPFPKPFLPYFTVSVTGTVIYLPMLESMMISLNQSSLPLLIASQLLSPMDFSSLICFICPLSIPTTTSLVQALLITDLDYCNSVLINFPISVLFPPQDILYTAIRFICLMNRSGLVTFLWPNEPSSHLSGIQGFLKFGYTILFQSFLIQIFHMYCSLQSN